MDFKLGISVRSLASDASDIDIRLSEIVEYQPDSIELMCFAQDLIRNGDIIIARAERISRALVEKEISATMHGPISLNLMDHISHLDAHIEVGKSYIKLASMLGVRAMVIHTGYCSDCSSEDLDAKYANQRDGLRRLADYAGSLDVTIYLENIFPFFQGAHTALPGKLAEELTVINHPYLLGCFDVSHAYIACTAYEVNFLGEINQFATMSPHWHVHDSFGRPETSLKPYGRSEGLAYGIGDLHLAVGDGNLPWGDVLSVAPPAIGTTFNIELNPAYWPDMGRCVERTRDLMVNAVRSKAA